MNDCYLNFLVSFRALFSLDVGANLVCMKTVKCRIAILQVY